MSGGKVLQRAAARTQLGGRASGWAPSPECMKVGQAEGAVYGGPTTEDMLTDGVRSGLSSGQATRLVGAVCGNQHSGSRGHPGQAACWEGAAAAKACGRLVLPGRAPQGIPTRPWHGR